MKKLPLHKIHKSAKADFCLVGEWKVPNSYCDPADEYLALMNSVCLIDRSYLGKIRLTGKDSMDLLNRITTNDLTELTLGNACDTIFTTPKGRIVDYCRVLNLNEGIIIISSHNDTTHLRDWITRFIIFDDVELQDVSEEYIWLMLSGPESMSFLQQVDQSIDMRNDDHIRISRGNDTISVFGNTDYITPAFDICLPLETGETIADELYKVIQKSGGALAGYNSYQALRVESGLPAWGSELSEIYNPHEARLCNAVSFTKGCYTGQEVIARLDTYDKVQKYLMVIDPDEEIKGELPLDIYLADEKIGHLTSVVINPHSGKQVGLAYIGKHFAVEDFQVQAEVMDGENRVQATLRVPPKKLT